MTRETNLYLRPKGATASDGKDVPTGTVYWHQDRLGRRFAFRVALANKSRHRQMDAWGVNTAVLDYLKRHGIREVYRTNRGDGRTYRTTTAELDHAGVITPLKDGLGAQINLASELWEEVTPIPRTWVSEHARTILPIGDVAATDAA